MKAIIATLAVLGGTAPAFAYCPDDMERMFYCQVVERAAEVEMCHRRGQIRYTYTVDGEIELQFTGDAWGGVKRNVQGINGMAITGAARNGDTFYALIVEESLMGFDGVRATNSPNPAVIQIYASRQDYSDSTTDKVIARRVCEPSSIEFDSSNFGPG